MSYSSPAFPSVAPSTYENAGAVTGTSKGVTVTSSATPNTKGSYVQLIASTTKKASGIVLIIYIETANVSYLVDIATGVSGSEVPILPNVLVSDLLSGNMSLALFIPISIPAGTRLSSRCQSTGVSATCEVLLLIAEPPNI